MNQVDKRKADRQADRKEKVALEKHYTITFSGEVAAGHKIEDVKRNLTRILKLGDKAIADLFTGKQIIIRRNVDHHLAMKYRMAFETAGAICRLHEVKADPRTGGVPETDRGERPKSRPPRMMTCPSCGLEQEAAEQCMQCGIIIKKYQRKSKDTIQKAPRYKMSQLYFAVSKTKLIVMSLCSFGIYEIYWFYKNWTVIKKRPGQNIRPFWRAIFAIFYCYSLFKSVKETGNSHGLQSGISPGWLAFGYIALTVLYRLPAPFWLISLLAFLPLLPVQEAINHINEKTAPDAGRNDRFSGKNIAVIIVGAILFVLVIIGSFVPE